MPQPDISAVDCGNGPGPPIPSVTTCTGISATDDGQGYWVRKSSYSLLNGVRQYAVVGIPQGAVGGHCTGPVSGGLSLPPLIAGLEAANVGVWLAAADGGVFAGCGAPFDGTMGATPLHAAMQQSGHCPDERVPCLLPPAESSVVALHASHLVEHADEVRVTGINSALDKRTAASHWAVQVMDQFTAPIGIQLLPATFDEHEDDTIHEHEFVNIVSPSWPSAVA